MKETQHLQNKCLICHTDITLKNRILANKFICKKCYFRLPFIFKSFNIGNVKCLAIYEYNDFMKNLLLQIKANGDKELAQVPFNPVKDYLKCHYRNYIILPVPSSKTNDEKRGFNHISEMIKVINLPSVNAFYKDKVYKQSSQGKYERLNIKKIIQVDKNLISAKNKYLIIDDLSTTGQTLKRCIELLKQNNIKNIRVVILCIRRNKGYE